MKKILAVFMVICVLLSVGAVPVWAKLSLSEYANKVLFETDDNEIVYSAIMYEAPDDLHTCEFSYWVQQRGYLDDTMEYTSEFDLELRTAYKEYVDAQRKAVLEAGKEFFERHFDASADELVLNSDLRALVAVKSTAAKVKALENAEDCRVFAVGTLTYITERFNDNNCAVLVPYESYVSNIAEYELLYALSFYEETEEPRYWDTMNSDMVEYIYTPLYYHYPEIDSATADEPDYIMVFAGSNICSPALAATGFGDKYLVQSYNVYYPYILGLHIFTVEDMRFHTLREAWNRGIEGIEDVFLDYGLGEIRGDSDGDKKITVRDATFIQKCIAGIEKFSDREYVSGIAEFGYENNAEYGFYGRVSDMNMDGIVNVKDATAVQKCVAGLEYK